MRPLTLLVPLSTQSRSGCQQIVKLNKNVGVGWGYPAMTRKVAIPLVVRFAYCPTFLHKKNYAYGFFHTILCTHEQQSWIDQESKIVFKIKYGGYTENLPLVYTGLLLKVPKTLNNSAQVTIAKRFHSPSSLVQNVSSDSVGLKWGFLVSNIGLTV